MTVHTIVPGDFSVPTDRNQSGPSTTMPGMLAMVSALLTRVGAAAVSSVSDAMGSSAADLVSGPSSSVPWR